MERKNHKDIELRECRPSSVPLVKSYYHGACVTPLSSDTLGDLLHQAATSDSQHVAFKAPEFDQQLTWEQLKSKADRLSKSLIQAGLKKGERVIILGVPDIEFVVIYFALTQIGLLSCAPEIEYPFDEVLSQNIALKPAVWFLGCGLADPETDQVIERLLKDSDSEPTKRQTVVAVGNKKLTKGGSVDYGCYITRGDQISDIELSETKSRVDPDDLAAMLISSGSTGKPKMPCLSHHTLVNLGVFCSRRVNPYAEGPVVNSALNPVHDDMGVIVTIARTVASWRDKMTTVLVPTNVTMEPHTADNFLKFVEEERITWHGGLPFEFIHAIENPNFESFDSSCLKGGNLLSQAVSTENKIRLLNKFPDMVTLFGSTEAPAGLATSALYSTYEQRLHAIGYPFPHCEVKIVDSDGVIAPVGSVGEICIRGWTVLREYVNDPELTAAVKHNNMAGWYHYGDLGVMDETGHVTYKGRLVEALHFKHHDIMVYPGVLEEAVQTHPSVMCSKVVGVHSDYIGTDLCLFIEPKPNMTISEDEIRILLQTKIMEKEMPDHFFIMETLPRTGARQKIAIKELQKIAEDRVHSLRNN